MMSRRVFSLIVYPVILPPIISYFGSKQVTDQFNSNDLDGLGSPFRQRILSKYQVARVPHSLSQWSFQGCCSRADVPDLGRAHGFSMRLPFSFQLINSK